MVEEPTEHPADRRSGESGGESRTPSLDSRMGCLVRGAGMREDERAAEEETIVAISTAVGAGAIGIVRLSGPRALEIARKGFRPARDDAARREETYRLVYGHVVDPCTGDVVDEALLAVMRRPHSYTREDIAELQCHGGIAAQRAVLRLMVALGARLAEPGEFTRRAFLNGRIDLAQAESVAAIVGARSMGALRASVRQLEGGLSERLKAARHGLVGALARLEACVDFADEDVEEVDRPALAEVIEGVHTDLVRLLETAFVGRAFEEGVRTAIVGRPNVGKSSLLNALLMRERAIVSDIPGTTRDTVEELMEIGGIPIHLVDTAGIRSDGDHVERLGVARSVRAMEQADLIVAVMDLSAPLVEADGRFVEGLDRERMIVVGNKWDLVRDGGEAVRGLAEVAGCEEQEIGVPGVRSEGRRGPDTHGRRTCVVSAMTGEGLEELRSLIQEVILGEVGLRLEEPMLANERQRGLVGEASEATAAALAVSCPETGEELVCEDLRTAIEALGRITGEDLTPDLLDEIFSRFCIGK